MLWDHEELLSSRGYGGLKPDPRCSGSMHLLIAQKVMASHAQQMTASHLSSSNSLFHKSFHPFSPGMIITQTGLIA